ncbi:MAG TPA: hypothetical protein P5081_22140 [Phycisphaerae bacterium]|nr:hypothetical protein [Phycisphaerae bacterium]HRW55582.1 hypothetical protein [Phycisphaerae bacterium]
MPDFEHWWFAGALGLALTMTVGLSIRSGRKRERLSNAYFGVLALALTGLIAAAGLFADSWFTWKSRDDAIARAVSRHDPRFVESHDHGYYALYEFRNPDTGQLAMSVARYKYAFPDVTLVAIPCAVAGLIVAFAVRALTVRIMGRRLLVGHCASCGYDLQGNESGLCPECGQVVVAAT